MGRGVVLAMVVAALVAAAPARAAVSDGHPNDPLFDASPLPNATDEQWDLASPAGGFDRGISADRAWPLSTGAGITIAELDVGVQLDHPDLKAKWAPGGHDFYERDDDPTSDIQVSHGT